VARKRMTPERRRAISARMKKYWANQRSDRALLEEPDNPKGGEPVQPVRQTSFSQLSNEAKAESFRKEAMVALARYGKAMLDVG
jgi:hypothetical protein